MKNLLFVLPLIVILSPVVPHLSEVLERLNNPYIFSIFLFPLMYTGVDYYYSANSSINVKLKELSRKLELVTVELDNLSNHVDDISDKVAVLEVKVEDQASQINHVKLAAGLKKKNG